TTGSADFPTTTGAFQTALVGVDDAFVTKLNLTGTALVYSTFVGGNGIDEGAGIALDAAGDAYITGATQSANFPTTAGAFQPAFDGIEDAFISKLNAGGTALLYSTYLGGSSGEEGVGITADTAGNSYVVGFTSSANFPTTAGALQTALGGT